MKLKLNKQVLKSKLTLFYVLAGIFGLGFSSMAATAVPFESRAMAANVTAGDTRYYESGVSAKAGDVVKIQVYYHNKAASDSGRIATNVNVKFTMPSNTLKTSNAVSTRVSGSNINTITDSTAITTSIPAKLEYIPGTAYRKYNAGSNSNPNIREINISDSVVTGNGYSIPEVKPCWNFEETITIQARVLAPGLTIVKKVKVAGQATYQTDITANPGDTLEYAFEVKNVGSMNLTHLSVRDQMPQGLTHVPGSVVLKDIANPNGKVLSDALFTTMGSDIGSYTPGSNAFIFFRATVPTTNSNCGTSVVYNNRALARATEISEKYNNAITRVTFPCVARYDITAIKFNDRNRDGVQNFGEPRINDWGMTLTGNGQNQTIRTNSSGEARFNDLTVGTYTVTEENRAGWSASTPTSVQVVLNNSNEVVRFGNYQPTYSITAIKFKDDNRNGIQDSGEERVDDWTMTLTGNGVNRNIDTNNNGEAVFENLVPGTYTVREESRTGWTNVTPVSREVVITNANQTVNFANYRGLIVLDTGSITALKYEDINGNGTRDTNEPGIANWEIRLTDSENNVTTRRTGTDGLVEFTDLEFGTYSVAEVMQDGWRNTTPLVQSVALSETNIGPEVRFGNQRVVTPPPVTPNGDVTPVSSTVINTTGKGTLAASGPVDAAAGALGTVSLGGAAFAWMKSKKALLMALKKY